MSYDFQEMIGTAFPEEIAESICFTIIEFANNAGFDDELISHGAKKLLLDFTTVPKFSQWDEESVGCVLERLSDNYLSELAGRPVHKMAAMSMAVSL